MGWGWGWGMGLMMMVFWVAVLVGAVWLIRYVVMQGRSAGPFGGPTRESALDVLARRYANGEIDRAEFEQKRRDLEDLRHRPPGPSQPVTP